MEGTLRVKPEELLKTSQEFGNAANTVNNQTQQMLQIVKGMNAKWQGEGASSFITKFNALETDMQKLFRMIQEHSSDLNEMGTRYSQRDVDIASGHQALNSKVIS